MSAPFLRGSENYVWITTNVLGKGATGSVFQGVNKKNGQPVAVKTFNQVSLLRHPDVQHREFEVIRKVNHENIVKLLAIEEEKESRGDVIVMELCTGGSLYTILDDPENTYGLHEDEFLLVLDHLTAGIKHLRENNLVHRDLKPGNIMKFIADDGRTIYKLTDFGAARELREGQEFQSMYGTEEYLHPHMYERAVLRRNVGKTFGANVDLWSIGVTLYHVATGNLPFRPFGGRRNRDTMHRITSKKVSGVISGIQLSDNGPITWSNDLPSSCRLSTGLQYLVTPLLARLLEFDQKRVWNYDNFFEVVAGILSRKVLHIFYLNRSQSIRMYLHPEGRYEQVQSLVRDQTEVSPDNQILLLKDQSLLAYVEETTVGRGYPTTTELCPIMLLSKDDNNVIPVPEHELPPFPAFPNSMSVDHDPGIAKDVCSAGHDCKRRIERLACTSRLNHLCVEVMSGIVSKDLERVMMRSDKLQELTRYAEELVSAVCRCQTSVRELHNMNDNDQNSNVRKTELHNLKELINGCTLAIKQLHEAYVINRKLKQEWSTATRDLKCPAEARLPQKAKTYVDRLRDSWQHLLRDKATRTLTFNDEQFHVLERIKVAETGRLLISLLMQESLPPLAQQAEYMADWYKVAQTVFLKTQILEKDVLGYETGLESFLFHVVSADQSFHEELSKQMSSKKVIGESTKQKVNSRLSALSEDDTKLFIKNLKGALDLRKDILGAVQENAKLVHKLQLITQTLQPESTTNP